MTNPSDPAPQPAEIDLDVASTQLLRYLKVDPRDDRLWGEFIRRYQPFIATIVTRCGGKRQDVEDILQEVIGAILQAWQGGRGLDPDRKAWRAYLWTCVRTALGKIAARKSREAGTASELCFIADPYASDPNAPSSVGPRSGGKGVEEAAEEFAGEIAKHDPFWVRAIRLLPAVEEKVRTRMKQPERYDSLASFLSEEIDLAELAHRLNLKLGAASKAAYDFRRMLGEAFGDIGFEPASGPN